MAHISIFATASTVSLNSVAHLLSSYRSSLTFTLETRSAGVSLNWNPLLNISHKLRSRNTEWVGDRWVLDWERTLMIVQQTIEMDKTICAKKCIFGTRNLVLNHTALLIHYTINFLKLINKVCLIEFPTRFTSSGRRSFNWMCAHRAQTVTVWHFLGSCFTIAQLSASHHPHYPRYRDLKYVLLNVCDCAKIVLRWETAIIKQTSSLPLREMIILWDICVYNWILLSLFTLVMLTCPFS